MAKKNPADKIIDTIYRKNCSNIEVNILDIGKIFDVGRKSFAAGDNEQVMTQKIVDFVKTIRKN